jgi:hypothetical protein
VLRNEGDSVGSPQRFNAKLPCRWAKVVKPGGLGLGGQAASDQAGQIAVSLGGVKAAAAGHLGEGYRAASLLESLQHARPDLDRVDALRVAWFSSRHVLHDPI